MLRHKQEQNNINHRSGGGGFTLIELIVAIFIVTFGTGAAFMVINQGMALSSISSSQFTAAYLAQEGLENIRNIRDGNWLEKRTNPLIAWDEGISSDADWQTISFSDGSQSKFQRKITIQKPQPDKMTVSAQIKFEERGRTHIVAAETELYDWR